MFRNILELTMEDFIVQNRVKLEIFPALFPARHNILARNGINPWLTVAVWDNGIFPNLVSWGRFNPNIQGVFFNWAYPLDWATQKMLRLAPP